MYRAAGFRHYHNECGMDQDILNPGKTRGPTHMGSAHRTINTGIFACVHCISVKNSPAGEPAQWLNSICCFCRELGFNPQHAIAAYNWLFLKWSCPHFIHLVPALPPDPRVSCGMCAHIPIYNKWVGKNNSNKLHRNKIAPHTAKQYLYRSGRAGQTG